MFPHGCFEAMAWTQAKPFAFFEVFERSDRSASVQIRRVRERPRIAPSAALTRCLYRTLRAPSRSVAADRERLRNRANRCPRKGVIAKPSERNPRPKPDCYRRLPELRRQVGRRKASERESRWVETATGHKIRPQVQRGLHRKQSGIAPFTLTHHRYARAVDRHSGVIFGRLL